jgi:hypothetical protein
MNPRDDRLQSSLAEFYAILDSMHFTGASPEDASCGGDAPTTYTYRRIADDLRGQIEH